jgi:hypothetical protein
MTLSAPARRPCPVRLALAALLLPTLLFAALCLSPAAGALADETVATRAAMHGGYGRLVFDWPNPAKYRMETAGRVLTLHFERPFSADLSAIQHHLSGLIEDIRFGGEPGTVIVTLRQPMAVKSFAMGGVVGVDLRSAAAETAASPAPPAVPAPAETTRPTAVSAAPREPAQARPQEAKPREGKPQEAKLQEAKPQNPVLLSLSPARGGGYRLVLASRAPFDMNLSTQDRDTTVTLSRALQGPRDLSPIAAWQPRLSDTALTVTVPEGRELRPTRQGGRIILELAAKVPQPADIVSRAKPGAPRNADAVPPAAPDPMTPAPVRNERRVAASEPATENPVAAIPPGRAPKLVKIGPLTDGASLRFAPVPSAAAVFRRGDHLWVAFDGAGALDFSDVREHGGPVVDSPEIVRSPSGTVLRFHLADGVEPALRRGESEWIVDLTPNPARADTPLQPSLDGKPARLRFAVARPAQPIMVSDPEIGDALVIVPLPSDGQGVAAARMLVDLDVLATVQGLAFQPKSDAIRITAAADRVEATSGDGLLASAAPGTRIFHPRRERTFDLTAWARGGDLLENRHELQHAIVVAAAKERTWPRIDLARFFLANAYGAEARGVIDAVARDDPAAMADPSLRALRGMALLLAGNTEEAANDLATPLIDGDRDLELWRGALLFKKNDLAGAATAFTNGMNVLASYPQPLRSRLALQAAEARLSSGQDDGGFLALAMQDAPSAAETMAATYLEGRALERNGDKAGALQKWDEVIAGADRESRVRATMARAELLLALGKIDRATAIDTLDRLRFAWRGDDFEFKLLHRIGELKIEDGDYRGGFAILKQAVASRTGRPEGASTMAELKAAFAQLFLGPAAARVPPLKALALYEDYRDLAPEGTDGDAITRKLADRLAAVDLLDRAAALLDNQARTRLAGAEKARVMTRVALLRLLDRKPGAALEALDLDVGKDLPPELKTQRRELRARAALELDHPSDALAALDGDETRQADKLRAEIAFHAEQWGEAAKVFQRLVGDPPAGAPLDDEAARLVLNWGAALTLAQDHDGVAALREKYEAAMDKTQFRDGFRVVLGADTAGAADLHQLTRRLAQVSDLQTFMASYKKLVAGESLSAIN